MGPARREVDGRPQRAVGLRRLGHGLVLDLPAAADDRELARHPRDADDDGHAEHGLGLVKAGRAGWSPAVEALHATIKRAFDPKGLLNPGKKIVPG